MAAKTVKFINKNVTVAFIAPGYVEFSAIEQSSRFENGLFLVEKLQFRLEVCSIWATFVKNGDFTFLFYVF